MNRLAKLSPHRIAEVSLKLIDTKGLPAFSIRAVAKALKVVPMALYNHVQDKAELAALVLHHATTKRPLPPLTGDWVKDLLMTARWLRSNATAHPMLGTLERTYAVWTPVMVEVAERWTTVWRQSGLNSKNALRAASASGMALRGLIEHQATMREWTPQGEETLSRSPNAQRYFRDAADREELFDLAVRSVIEGLYANLSTEKRSTGRELSTPKPRRGRSRISSR